MSRVEIIDEYGDVINSPKSAIEKLTDVSSYVDLVLKVQNLKTDTSGAVGDNKNYSPMISRNIWKTVILGTKPLVARNDSEHELLRSIYKILYAFAMGGEYPLLQQLCNYLGVTMDEFFAIMSTSDEPKREVYLWAYNVFESAAQMNAVRSNGNINARQWIDKSRENKLAAEDKIELAIEKQKLDRLQEHGAEIAREMLEE